MNKKILRSLGCSKNKEFNKLKKNNAKLKDTLEKILAFHGAHDLYTKDCVTGELYSLEDSKNKLLEILKEIN